MPMRAAVRQPSLIRCLAAFAATACVLLGAGPVAGAAQAGAAHAGAAQAGTAGILPPRNPASDCDRTNAGAGYWSVTSIDSCRALEGVGPLTLPTNWKTLTPVQQGFVLIDLERVNRGLAPIVGLSPALNRLAADGAANGDDPSFPAGSFGGGAIWAGAGSVLAADYLWMYDDGPNGLDTNLACPSAGAPGCWGHRDIILWNRGGGQLVAGGGYAASSDGGSFAYLVMAGYPAAGLSFTWAGELRYFTAKPAVEHTGQAAATATPHKRTAASHRQLRRRSRRHPARRLNDAHHRVRHAKHRAIKRPRHSSPASSQGGPTITFG